MYVDAGFRLNGRDLRKWIHKKREDGQAPGSIHNSAIAIRKWCKVFDREIRGAEAELVSAALLTASKRNKDKRRGSAPGISWEDAEQIAELAGRTGDLRGLRDKAIILLASDAFLRVSEVAALNVEDLTFNDDGSGGLVYLATSKTDQLGEGTVLFLGPQTQDALLEYMKTIGIKSGPLFINERGPHAGGRMKALAIGHMLGRRAKAAGFKGRFTFHGLRRGSASSMILAGAATQEVMDSGRWESEEMVRRYTRGELAAKGGVARYRYGIGK